LPVVAALAPDYADEVAFVAVAGRAAYEPTAARAAELFGDKLDWGLDDDLWATYDVPGQPTVVLIVDGVEVDRWFGAIGEDALRERVEQAVAGT
jgi:hypothetical protein